MTIHRNVHETYENHMNSHNKRELIWTKLSEVQLKGINRLPIVKTFHDVSKRAIRKTRLLSLSFSRSPPFLLAIVSNLYILFMSLHLSSPFHIKSYQNKKPARQVVTS
jgi:hypothetical protein